MDAKDNNVRTSIVKDDADHHSMDDLDPTGVRVKPKWRGTARDQMDMETLGRNQVLRVRRPSRCARSRSLPGSLLTNRCREIFDFYPCLGSEAHSFVLGKSYWRKTCTHACEASPLLT